jgi:hypothetical protein
MHFIVETKTAPAGTISHLYVQGLVEEVWKASFSVNPDGHYLTTGKWGKDKADADRLLKKEIEKEIKRWASHSDPRPSQTRRMNILTAAMAVI